jgi:hypothetical protein
LSAVPRCVAAVVLPSKRSGDGEVGRWRRGWAVRPGAAGGSRMRLRPGRVAQRESARFTRERSLVRNQPRPSFENAVRQRRPGPPRRRHRRRRRRRCSAPRGRAPCSSRSGVRPVRTTSAPSLRARRAVSSPMPALPPMTTTVWPSSCGSRATETLVVTVVMLPPAVPGRVQVLSPLVRSRPLTHGSVPWLGGLERSVAECRWRSRSRLTGVVRLGRKGTGPSRDRPRRTVPRGSRSGRAQSRPAEGPDSSAAAGSTSLGTEMSSSERGCESVPRRAGRALRRFRRRTGRGAPAALMTTSDCARASSSRSGVITGPSSASSKPTASSSCAGSSDAAGRRRP